MRPIIIKLFALLVLAFPLAAQAEAYGPDIGSKTPHDFSLKDQDGNNVSFASLVGEKGLVVFFVRSADWCKFCKAQMQDFAGRYQAFKTRGYNLVSVSYDDIEVLRQFKNTNNIPYPMLSDTSAASIKAYGILNQKFKQGSRFYGVPKPGIFVLNREGFITHKFAEKGYQSRPAIDGVLSSLE